MSRIAKKQKFRQFVSKLISIFSIMALAVTTWLVASHTNRPSLTPANVQYAASADDAPPNSNREDGNLVVAYPETIPFALAPLTTIIPDSLPAGQAGVPPKFEKFIGTLLTNPAWTQIKSAQTNDYTNALLDIFEWYNRKRIVPQYSGDFPANSKNLLSSANATPNAQNLKGQFQKINGIPAPPEDLNGVTFKYIIPNVANVLDQSYGSETPSAFPILQSFDYKIVAIDLNKLEGKNRFIELEYQYLGQSNLPKYRIFINNKDNLLKSERATINDLLANGNILFRNANSKYQPGQRPELLNNLNLAIVKNESKIEFFTSLKQKNDSVILRVNLLPDAWKAATKIGIIESPLSPHLLQRAVASGPSFRLVPNDATLSFDGHREKSAYIPNSVPSGSGSARATVSIIFYMATNEKIELPIFYQNKRISGAATISLTTNDQGEVQTSTPSLKIPGSDYQEDIEPIKVQHRTQTVAAKIWTEVEIVTSANIIVGSKDVIRSTAKKPRHGTFDLQRYNANQRHIIFERPAEFTTPAKELEIGYSKIFDSASETAKLVGQAYYSAWGVYDTPKFDVRGNPAAIVVPEVVTPQFGANKLAYLPTQTRRFTAAQKPANQAVVPNNFGKLVEDINDYSNLLNNVIKAITNESLFAGYEKDYLKPSVDIQEQKFVTEILLPKNKSKAVETAFAELQIATEVFVNGQQALEDYDGTLPAGIKEVKKKNRAAWLAFARPRIETIVQDRYQTLLSNFQTAIFNFKYTMINQLLEANSANSRREFNGINKNLITEKTMVIGPKQQTMMLLTDGNQRLEKYTTFKAQLTSFLKALVRHPIVGKIIGPSQAANFETQTQILQTPKASRDNEKRIVVQTSKHLFKIADYFAKLEKKSLVAFLTINSHIKDKAQRLSMLIDIFNAAIENFVKSQAVTVVAYALQTTINSRQIDVAVNNVQKIFDSFLARPNLSQKALVAVTNLKNYDYWSNPNKLAALAIKIGEYDLAKFFNDLTRDDIKGVAKKILKLNPLLELPSNLPPQSQFVDIIKHASERTKVSFTVLGTMAGLVIVFIVAIGYRNRKILTLSSKILIAISLFSVATLIIVIGFMLPAVALPLAA